METKITKTTAPNPKGRVIVATARRSHAPYDYNDVDKYRSIAIDSDNLTDVTALYDAPETLWKATDGLVYAPTAQLTRAIVKRDKPGDRFTVDAVTIGMFADEFGNERELIDLFLRRVSAAELAEWKEAKDERDRIAAQFKADMDSFWKLALKKSKVRPVEKAAKLSGEPTLDRLEKLLEESPEVKLSVRRGRAILVEAPAYAALHATVETRGFSTVSAGRVSGSIRHAQGRAEAIHALCAALGELAIAYVKTGERPKSDVGRGLANRVSQTGVWLP